MEDIGDADYKHSKRVWEDLELKKARLVSRSVV